MRYTRNRNSKALRAREGSGRFAKTPSLEGAGLVDICPKCGAIHLIKTEWTEGPFAMPKKVHATECRNCGAKLEK